MTASAVRVAFEGAREPAEQVVDVADEQRQL